MAGALSTPPLSRYGAHSPSLEGLERVIRHLPQPSPRSRPSPVTSRKSSSSDVNKPLPPSPPPPLFTPSPGLQVSPRSRSRSPGNFSSRRPSPLSAGLNAPRAYSAASASPSSIIESYSNRPEWTPAPRIGTPLLAPTARVSLTPVAQDQRLQAFEYFATHSPLDSASPFPEQYPQPGVQPIAVQEEKHGVNRAESLAYTFDTQTTSRPNPRIVFQQPAWASDTNMSSEDMADRYRKSLFPSPFTAILPPKDTYNGLGSAESTPTRLTLPPLSQQSSFTVDKVLDEDDILTPTIPPTQLPLSPLPWAVISQQAQATSHEDSYRALPSPPIASFVNPSFALMPPPPPPNAPFHAQPEAHRPSDASTSSWSTGADSQVSWEQGDDTHMLFVDGRVSPLDSPEPTQMTASLAPNLLDRAPRPKIQDYELYNLPSSSTRTESPGQSHSQTRDPARKSRAPPILKGRDPLTAAERQSALSSINTAALRTGIGGAGLDASDSEYEDDSPGACGSTFGSDAQASHFSDDSDDDETKKKRRSNPLTHLRKALGHRKTPSAGSEISAMSVAMDKKKPLDLAFIGGGPGTPPPPAQAKRPGHARGKSMGKALDEKVEDMYDTLQRFSFDPAAAKRKSQLRKSGIARPLSKAMPSPAMVSAYASASTRPGTPRTPRTPRADGAPAGHLGRPPNTIRKRSDTVPVPRLPVTPGTPGTPEPVALRLKSSTWGVAGSGEGSGSGSGYGAPEGLLSPASGREDDRSEGWLARRRRKKEEAKREKWREELKGQIKLVQEEPQDMMAVAPNDMSGAGGLL